MTATIAICMATWNGAAHLEAQLASIAAQTWQDWHLHVRDDGSSDATPEILARFAADNAGRVTVVQDDLGQLGAAGNFSHLMGLVPPPYVAFADQDDVWHPDKLVRAVEAMQQAERQHGAETPVMIHADRRLIDATGREITPSYWRSRGIVPAAMRGEGHLSFCVAAGAAMLINRSLATQAHPLPDGARMYDCWIELVAHAFGRVVVLDEIALDHRRHGRNTSGARGDIDSPGARKLGARAARLWRGLDRQCAITRQYLDQAAAFQARYGQALPPRWQRCLSGVRSLPMRQSGVSRLWTLLASGAAPPGVARTLVFAALSGPAPDVVLSRSPEAP